MSTGQQASTPSRRPTLLLGLGALAGLLASAIGLLAQRPAEGALPPGAVAVVNDVVIRSEAYERALAALAADRREPLGPGERRHVLERLLDEELLVQRGLELGLARHDRRVRGDLVSAVIQSVVAQTEGYEPDADELEAFYRANAEYFARTPRLAVRRLLVKGPPQRSADDARARADAAARRLGAGESFDAVAGALGDEPIVPLPADPLPPQKLREYVGPSASAAAGALEPGASTGPLASGSGWQILQLVARDAGFVPPLAAIEQEVRSELRRRAGDAALREYLDELRERADLRIALPEPS